MALLAPPHMLALLLFFFVHFSGRMQQLDTELD